MEDEYPDARPHDEFDWFAPWQWEQVVLVRVSLIAVGVFTCFLGICCIAILCGGVCSIHGR